MTRNTRVDERQADRDNPPAGTGIDIRVVQQILAAPSSARPSATPKSPMP